MTASAIMLAGVPVVNQSLFHRLRLPVGDAAVYIEVRGEDGARRRTVLVRDIEMQRARAMCPAERIACAADFAPDSGLSADRDTAIAQAAAECLRRAGVRRVCADRSLPYIFAWHAQQAGVAVDYDPQLGVLERRVKSETEIEHLRAAQAMTEQAMRFACELIARADADARGVLLHDGESLTSQRVRRMVSIFLMERGFSNVNDSIVATTPHAADCHHHGDGPLRTGEAVIVDIFPRDDATRYWGDCTRTVVHGEVRHELTAMHAAVVAAKAAAIDALRPGATGEAVHRQAVRVLSERGYPAIKPAAHEATELTDETPNMPHGTGHGIGLDVHEPILLDDGGGDILAGEVFTVEPGLYCRAFGGVRVEDMVAVTEAGPVNLNTLYEGLEWR